ncbi:MAG TPA: DUF192 domain-containing protein [Solirubrobacterales bacterium]|nr:DUF192 domain-containing protein [Solirubrobacterales bacterium]
MAPLRFRQSRVAHASLGLVIPVADSVPARLLGLALLDRDRAGPGLLIPRCRSVHTFGMRFALDLHFLDGEGRTVEVRRGVPPGRLVRCRRAATVLEVPAPTPPPVPHACRGTVPRRA